MFCSSSCMLIGVLVLLSLAVTTKVLDVAKCEGGVFDIVLKHNPDDVYRIFLDKGERELADSEKKDTELIVNLKEELESQYRKRLSITNTSESVHLTLSGLTSADTDVYKTSVLTSDGNRSESDYNLTVHEPPLFHKEQRIYVVGNSEYVCGNLSFYGNPPVKFNWTCDGDGTVRTTTINTIKCEDCKKCYKCLAFGPAMDVCGITFSATHPELGPNSSWGGLNPGIIVAILLAVAMVAVVAAILFEVVRRKRKRRFFKKEKGEGYEMARQDENLEEGKLNDTLCNGDISSLQPA